MQSALPLGLLVMAATPLWAPRAVKAALPLCLSVVQVAPGPGLRTVEDVAVEVPRLRGLARTRLTTSPSMSLLLTLVFFL